MKITVVGLGLIGGSLCKHIKKHTDHIVTGIDTDPETVAMALSQGAIDYEEKEPGSADITVIGLFPDKCIDYCIKNAGKFKKHSIVMDVCGIKSEVVKAVEPVLAENDVIFVGCHPMAGREFSGFEYSLDDLFNEASFIMTPTENTPQTAVNLLEDLANAIKFKKVVITTAEEHDSIIAFTSQLAHVVSSAYIKSPTSSRQSGFSAGSYQDLTRVAKLNENMWTPLFLMNRDPLLFEIDNIMARLAEYRDSIAENDPDTLRELLKNGRILKENSLKNN